MAILKFERGQSVGHFRIEKMLGEGGMGAVYRAEDLTLSRRVAIKFMHRSLLVQRENDEASKRMEKRFIREAKSAAAINHPNIAQIYEANFDSDNWFIAMEFIDGNSLYDLMEEGKEFSISEVVNTIQQIISGLEFAWENYKIVHRDIKPHNIMLTKKGSLVKIVDLGLAKPLLSEDDDSDMPDVTCAGNPVGTPQYMAPEQAVGQKDISFSVDIFALGATLYEICSGKKAFSGTSAPMIYMAQVQKKYKPLNELRKDAPEELVSLIHRMMEPKVKDRIKSYEEIRKILPTIAFEDGAAPSSQFFHSGSHSLSLSSSHMSGKTIGIEGLTEYHSADKLIKDRYRILKSIGKSSAGVVYHCLDTKLGNECAIKSIIPGREYPPHEMPRVIDNFRRLMSFSHQNLIQIRDIQKDDQTDEFFIVMQLLEGRDLREYIHRLRNERDIVDIAVLYPILLSIAKALDSVSKTFGIIHHDLTPERIYLLNNGAQIKFLDYNISCPSPEDKQYIKPEDLHKFPLAIPDYMSPECWQRKSLSRQSDQYSLAVIIYEILGEKLPFWLKDPMNLSDSSVAEDGSMSRTREISNEERLLRLYQRVISEAPHPIERLKRHENKTLLKALSKNPHERFLNCEDFIFSLGKAKRIPRGLAASFISIAAIGGLVGLAYPYMKEKGNSQQQSIIANDSPRENSKEIKAAKGVKKQLTGLRNIVAQDSIASNLSDSIMKLNDQMSKADALFNKKDYAGATKQYQQAIILTKYILEKASTIRSQRGEKEKFEKQQKMKTARKLKEQLTDLQGKIKEDNIASNLSDSMMNLNDQISKADALFNKKNYIGAIARFQQAITLAKDILEKSGTVRAQIEIAQKLKDQFSSLQHAVEKDGIALGFEDDLLKLHDLAIQTNASMELEKYNDAVSQYQKAILLANRMLRKAKKYREQEKKTIKKEAFLLQREYQDIRSKVEKEAQKKQALSKANIIASSAKSLIDQNNYAEGISAYKEALDTAEQSLKSLEEALRLQKSFQRIWKEMKKDKEYASRMPEIKQSSLLGRGFLEKGNYSRAITSYEKAIDRAHDIHNDVKEAYKNQAKRLQETASLLREKVERYKKISPHVAEKLVKMDVLISIARESLREEEFKTAVMQFQDALDGGRVIQDITEGKFQAKRGRNFTNPKVGIEFIWIQSLNIWVGKYEVTNEEYQKFKPAHDSKKARGFSLNKSRQPVLEVSYYDAVGFCTWMNAISLQEVRPPKGYKYRLPLRSEWETVARCGTERIYPWGNQWPPPYGNFGNQELFPGNWKLDGYNDPFPVTCDVDKSGSNEWKIFGLAGNVWEWTTDLIGSKRTVMGGDWTSVSRNPLTLTVEGNLAPMDEPFDNIGFRVILAPEN